MGMPSRDLTDVTLASEDHDGRDDHGDMITWLHDKDEDEDEDEIWWL